MTGDYQRPCSTKFRLWPFNVSVSKFVFKLGMPVNGSDAEDTMWSHCTVRSTGAAHGLSGILQMLLCVPDFLKANVQMEIAVRESVDFMLGLQQPNGNVAPALDETSGKYQRPSSEELVHWCHGGPGKC